MNSFRKLAVLVLAGLTIAVPIACTTGETSEDQRDQAVRRMVQRMGVTQDVATCIVDQVEATLGLAALNDENPSDELTTQLNEITTDCLLVVPTGTGPMDTPSTTAPADAPVTLDPEAFSTTTGVPRG